MILNFFFMARRYLKTCTVVAFDMNGKVHTWSHPFFSTMMHARDKGVRLNQIYINISVVAPPKPNKHTRMQVLSLIYTPKFSFRKLFRGKIKIDDEEQEAIWRHQLGYRSSIVHTRASWDEQITYKQSRSDNNILIKMECLKDIPGLLTQSWVQPQLILEVYFISERWLSD